MDRALTSASVGDGNGDGSMDDGCPLRGVHLRYRRDTDTLLLNGRTMARFSDFAERFDLSDVRTRLAIMQYIIARICLFLRRSNGSSAAPFRSMILGDLDKEQRSDVTRALAAYAKKKNIAVVVVDDAALTVVSIRGRRRVLATFDFGRVRGAGGVFVTVARFALMAADAMIDHDGGETDRAAQTLASASDVIARLSAAARTARGGGGTGSSHSIKYEVQAPTDVQLPRDPSKIRYVKPTPDGWQNKYRIDVMFAMDDYITDNAGKDEFEWDGAFPSSLKREILSRINDKTFFSESVPPNVRIIYTDMIEHLVDLWPRGISFEKDVWDKVLARDFCLIATGWAGHALGAFCHKVNGGTHMEFAVENTGQGCNWHGAVPTHLSNQAEVPGILIFRPQPLAVIKEVLRRMHRFLSVELDGEKVLPALFYRFVLQPLFGGDPFSKDWVSPRTHPNISHYIGFPLQTTGDCAVRSVFFTVLSHRESTGRNQNQMQKPQGPSSPAKPERLEVPVWFWQWYGYLVCEGLDMMWNASVMWRFTQSEFTGMKERAERLAHFFEAVDRNGTKSGSDVTLQPTCKRLLDIAGRCAQSTTEWYEHTVLSSKDCLADAEITADVDTKPWCCINSENNITLHRYLSFEYDLAKALDVYGSCSSWSDIGSKMLPVLRDKRKRIYNHSIQYHFLLSKAEIMAITCALYRILKSSTAVTGERSLVVKTVSYIVNAGVQKNRLYDLSILYGLAYIALRRCIEAADTEGDKSLLDPIFNTFESYVNPACFNGPLYSKSHSDVVTFVVDNLRALKVLGDPKKSEQVIGSAYREMLKKRIGGEERAIAECAAYYGQFGQSLTNWKDSMAYLHAPVMTILYHQSDDGSRSEFDTEQPLVPLIYLSSYFNFGFGRYACIPALVADAMMSHMKQTETGGMQSWTHADLFNPFRHSLDIFYNLKEFMKDREDGEYSEAKDNVMSANPIASPADFFVRYGLRSMSSEDASSIQVKDSNYQQPALGSPPPDNLPPFEVTQQMVRFWIRKLGDTNDEFTIVCTDEDWNLLVYALTYILHLYGPAALSGSPLLGELNDLIESNPRSGDVVRLSVRILQKKKLGNSPKTWVHVLNGLFETLGDDIIGGAAGVPGILVNMYDDKEKKITKKHLRHDAYEKAVEACANAKFDGDIIFFHWILDQLCFEAAFNWPQVRPDHHIPQYEDVEKLNDNVHSTFMDSIKDSSALHFTAGGGGGGEVGSVFTASFRCYSHFSRELSYTIPLPSRRPSDAAQHYAVKEMRCIPTEKRHYRMQLLEIYPGQMTLRVLEPLLPHPYFQDEFVWTLQPGGSSYYGEPRATNLLKMNNYCLTFDPSKSKHAVFQTPPKPSSASRCDFSVLSGKSSTGSSAEEGAAAAEHVSIHDVIKNERGTSVSRMCARLLTFCFSDKVLVWRNPGSGGWTIEVLSHRAVISVTADGGAITCNGVEILQTLPNAELAFWTHQLPCVFLARSVEDPGELFLLVFDVHRYDPHVLRGISNNLLGIFGSNRNHALRKQLDVDDEENYDIQFYEKMQSEAASAGLIRMHPSGKFLLPSSPEALRSYLFVADHFGRTDVHGELAGVFDKVKKVFDVPGHPREGIVTNFARPRAWRSSTTLAVSLFELKDGSPAFKHKKENGGKMDNDFYEMIIGNAPGNVSIQHFTRFVEGSCSQPDACPEDVQNWVSSEPPKKSYQTDPHELFITTTKSNKPPPPSPSSSRILFERGVRGERHTGILHSLGREVREFAAANKWASLPAAFAQFMYVKRIGAIRDYQVKFADQVVENYVTDKPEIHNLVMGAGKTAVVTPLVILCSVYGMSALRYAEKDQWKTLAVNHAPDAAASIAVILPSKLLHQTVQLLLPLHLYLDIPLCVAKGANKVVSDGNPPPPPGIIMCSDRTMKERLINRRGLGDKVRYLFDEVDMMMNPFTSELNIPIDNDRFCTKAVQGKMCLAPIIDLMMELLSPRQCVCSRGRVRGRYNGVALPIRDHIEQRVVPFTRTRQFRLHYGHVRPSDQLQHMMRLLVSDGAEDGGGGVSLTDERRREILGYIGKFHGNNILAIPFLFAEVPSIGSEFSDPMLTVAYTILSLKKERLDIIRLYCVLLHVFKDSAKVPKATAKHVMSRYRRFLTVPNRWLWTQQNLAELQADDVLLREYLHHFIPLRLRVFTKTLSACGLDLVMSKFHPLRSGFTGTPEKGVVIQDDTPIQIREKDESNRTAERGALAKIDCEVVGNDVTAAVVKGLAANRYQVIIDVGSQFLGWTPDKLLCGILTARAAQGMKPEPLELVFWNDKDVPSVIDSAGVTSQWNGVHREHQVVFFDHAHTTGTDAVLRDRTHACLTIRPSTRYRDFIQGLFRLRKIVTVDGTRCTVLTRAGTVGKSNRKVAGDTESLKAFLQQNEDDYIASQSRLRGQQNVQAYYRSITGFFVVETSIGYIRALQGQPAFMDYLLNLINQLIYNKQAKVPLGTLTGMVKPNDDGVLQESQVEREGAQETEREMSMEMDIEKEKMSEKLPPNNGESPQYKFAMLFSTPRAVMDKYFITQEYGKITHRVSRLLSVTSPGLAEDQLVRPLYVTINKADNYVLTVPDALLLIDYVRGNSKLARTEVTVRDRDGHVWFSNPEGTSGGGGGSGRRVRNTFPRR